MMDWNVYPDRHNKQKKNLCWMMKRASLMLVHSINRKAAIFLPKIFVILWKCIFINKTNSSLTRRKLIYHSIAINFIIFLLTLYQLSIFKIDFCSPLHRHDGDIDQYINICNWKCEVCGQCVWENEKCWC